MPLTTAPTSLISLTDNQRPYSTNELNDIRNANKRRCRLGSVMATHREECNHCYYVRENGRKEKKIIDTGDFDPGNCSVCWKLAKTRNSVKKQYEDMVNNYMNDIATNDDITYSTVDTEDKFYKWLYLEK